MPCGYTEKSPVHPGWDEVVINLFFKHSTLKPFNISIIQGIVHAIADELSMSRQILLFSDKVLAANYFISDKRKL